MPEFRPPIRFLNEKEIERWYPEMPKMIHVPPVLRPCANCNDPCEKPTAFFCSDICKEMAIYIRSCRKWLRDSGMQSDPEWLYALYIRGSFLNSAAIGGATYPRLERKIPPELRREVIERDGGKCVNCGEPGAEIDHMQDSSATLENLQLLCRKCHKEKTAKNIISISDEGELMAIHALHFELGMRIEADSPQLPCDNEQTWGNYWRSWPNMPDDAGKYTPRTPAMSYPELMKLILKSGRDAANSSE
jgi:hypothetical protein